MNDEPIGFGFLASDKFSSAVSLGLIICLCSNLGCNFEIQNAEDSYLKDADNEARPTDRSPSNQVHFTSADAGIPTTDSDASTYPSLDKETANVITLKERYRATSERSSYPILNSQDRRPPLLVVETDDTTLTGVPIGLFADQTFIMKSDGKIQFLDNNSIRRQAVVQERFRPIDRNSLALELHAEFGRPYTVKHEPPYLIVAQPNQAEAWSKRFRNIVNSFRLYCSTHGIETRPIEFPLTAVVFGTHAEFLSYSNSESAKLPPNCVGYYSQKSNRIVLFESRTGDNSETIATICHEAIHQLAFNSGLHQRLASTPLWLAEGFATMFESPGLAGLKTKEGDSRWPESRRQDWLILAKKPASVALMVESLIRSDSKFESSPMESYCVSWAMVAYLSQRRSRDFTVFLQRIASMPPYQEYSTSERFSDFRAVFGSDSGIMTKNLIQFIDSLP